MISQQVKSLSHQMRLFGIQASAERRAAEALASQLDPLEFLRLVLEDELLARRERAGKMLVTRAKFRSAADLEDWDLSYDRGVTKAKIEDAGLLTFFHNKENLLVLGGTGVGKTHFAIAVGRRACADGVAVAFIPMNFLFEEASAERAAGRYVSHVRRLSKTGVLILDDFGLRNYTHDEASVLVDILEDRYQKGAVVVTSQVNPDGWLKLFEDPVIGEAIVDRLRSPSQQLVLKGTSYRERLNATRAKPTTKSN